MNDIRLDTVLVAAHTPRSGQSNHFVKETMKKISTRKLANRMPATQRFPLFTLLSHLNKPALAVIGLVVITLISGAAYAAVHFAPALIQLLGRQTNPRGAIEYTVAGFAGCAKDQATAVEHFEVTKDAPPLSDEDVRKILQAKCELTWINGFVSTNWPTYGTNPEWKDGDTIYYARPDVLGKVTSIDQTKLTLDAHGQTLTYNTAKDEQLKAYQNGSEVALSSIKPDDSVFSIVRVSETHHDLSKPTGTPKDSVELVQAPNSMQTVGLLAVFKLSLPGKYYGDMQGYITEVPKCVGNEDEYCPSTPSTDVYPRGNGEASVNPHLQTIPNSEYREISGAVTELNDDTLTLKSRGGHFYTVTVGDAGFAVYNREYAKNYTTFDASLKVGSHIVIRYQQPKDASPRTITKEQVRAIVLQLEGASPRKDIRPY